MSGSRAVLTAFALGIVAACGGGSGGSAPPAPAPQPSPAPQPTPSPSAAPEPTPSPAPPSAPGGELALDIARVDPAPECDGLVPARAPAALVLAVDLPAGATCLGGTGDGAGRIAIGVREGETVTWSVHRADGSLAGAASGSGLEPLARQAEGWHGVASTALFSPFQESEHVTLDAAGAVGARTPIAPPDAFLVNDVRLAADPSGGSALVAAVTAVAGNHPSRTVAFRFGPTGAAVHPRIDVAAVPGPSVPFLGAGISRSGELVVTQREPGMLVWRWIGRDGAILAAGAAPQLDVGAADPVHLEPLLDGALAARFGTTWSAVIPHLGTTAAPAPDWLAARPGTELRFTRGNRGYALLPPPGEALPECAQVVELRSPAGRLCGHVTVRGGAGGCVGGRVEQGWDGTLIQQVPGDPCAAGTCRCAVRAWPRLLAAP